MPDGHCADPSLPLHLDQGRGSSKKESFSLRVSPALHPPERPSPRRADMAGHGHGSGDAGTEKIVRKKKKKNVHVIRERSTNECLFYNAQIRSYVYFIKYTRVIYYVCSCTNNVAHSGSCRQPNMRTKVPWYDS